MAFDTDSGNDILVRISINEPAVAVESDEYFERSVDGIKDLGDALQVPAVL